MDHEAVDAAQKVQPALKPTRERFKPREASSELT
jgi:hypothetical protein